MAKQKIIRMLLYFTEKIQVTESLRCEKNPAIYLKVTKDACHHTIGKIEMPAPPPPKTLYPNMNELCLTILYSKAFFNPAPLLSIERHMKR